MKRDSIKLGSIYEVKSGRSNATTIVKVVDMNPKTGAFICKKVNLEPGEKETTFSIADANRFVKKARDASNVEPTNQISKKKEKDSKPKDRPSEEIKKPDDKPKGKDSGKKEKVKRNDVQFTAKPKEIVDPETKERLKNDALHKIKVAEAAKNAGKYNLLDDSLVESCIQAAADAKKAAIIAGVDFGGKGGRAKGQMSGLDAAYRVLLEEGRPMKKKEICQLAHERGYCFLPGATPHETIGAQISTDIKRRGEKSRFRKFAPGEFEVNPDYAPE